MKRLTKRTLIHAALFLVLIYFSYSFFSSENSAIKIITSTSVISVDVIIANTIEKQTQGLMFKTHLGEHEGMLFVFDSPKQRHFWMKNTYLPLDILFIDKNNTILQIEHADPCTANPCRIYSSDSTQITQVLETNQNFTLKNKIMVGDKLVPIETLR